MAPEAIVERLRETTRFAVGPAFEVCYALAALTDDKSRSHPGWKASAGRRMPLEFAARFQRVGGTPYVWFMVPDAYPGVAADQPVDEVLAAVRAEAIEPFQHHCLHGLLHYPEHVEALLAGEVDLATVSASVPKAKREWFGHVGLYPFDGASPIARAVASLVRDPEAFRDDLIGLVEDFWTAVFRDTWNGLGPRLRHSVEETERLFAATSFPELADALRLRIEVNTERRYIQAIRGKYRLPIDELETCWILPSTAVPRTSSGEARPRSAALPVPPERA